MANDEIVNFYFKLLYPDMNKLDEYEYERALIDKRYIAEDLDRISSHFDRFSESSLEKTLENIRLVFNICKHMFFVDIFLDEYSNFTQKDDFGGEEQKAYDAKQKEIRNDLSILDEHKDISLKLYYDEIDNGCTPIQALNNVVEQLKNKSITDDKKNGPEDLDYGDR